MFTLEIVEALVRRLGEGWRIVVQDDSSCNIKLDGRDWSYHYDVTIRLEPLYTFITINFTDGRSIEGKIKVKGRSVKQIHDKILFLLEQHFFK